jgi:hypothetical protein
MTSNPLSNAEEARLTESRDRRTHWKRWGPYLSERQWGTVREDYSPDGSAWDSFPHDHARSRAYRWGEDGLMGISDRRQTLCFAVALWNGKDPILKERLFGLSGTEGNHGEDVKEAYYYLDSTPTHSWMQFLYKYPQSEYPYARLIEGNRTRSRKSPELELIDLGVFAEDRYWDVFVEYVKAASEDILIRIRAVNHGPSEASLHILPTLWYRNTWSWGLGTRRPAIRKATPLEGASVLSTDHPLYGKRYLLVEGSPEFLFTENETNNRRLWGAENTSPHVKDAFHDRVVGGRLEAVNPNLAGSKSAAWFLATAAPGKTFQIQLRLTNREPRELPLDISFDDIFSRRLQEADEFYTALQPLGVPEDARNVQRQALGGLLLSKQYYGYDVNRWLKGDPDGLEPPRSRLRGRNCDWTHVFNSDVISMPDKWEYPWYAAWDLAFHCIPLALVDPDFAKEQLILFTREWYMHPNGQLPAYEWAFGDVNPPVHAWAAWRVYKIDKKKTGRGDRRFLERVFHKLLLNFTWWVNRKDAEGKNVFQGGFLGLDNIGVFDRSATLPTGGHLEQSDATSWMGMYCLNMLTIALELARENPAYEDVASKFFEHFVGICKAMNDVGGKGIELWNREDGFYYDILHLPDGRHFPLRVRSMVGLIPLFAVETLDSDLVDSLPGFKRRMQWFISHRPELSNHVETRTIEGNRIQRFLSLVNPRRLRSILRYLLDENEFLSPFGVRALSKVHARNPYVLQAGGTEHRVDYEPAESSTYLFGGNSNWRGPVWFPVNFLLIESLQKFHYFLRDRFAVEAPSIAPGPITLDAVSRDLSRRLISIFLQGPDGSRPVFGKDSRLQHDPLFRDHVLFYEYFHGDDGSGLGASHQTGWTALVAKLIQQSGAGME